MSRYLQKRTDKKGGYYHVFNRGNNKQDIFLDVSDYQAFLNMLECYLTSESKYRPTWIKKTFEEDVHIIAYCLLPNHFHLLIKQIQKRALSDFLQAFSLRYTKYFNKKYGRVGHVFQGVFKARLIDSDGDLLNVSRYIHQNAKDITQDLCTYEYSSAQYFVLNTKPTSWLYPEYVFDILHGFFGVKKENMQKSYRKYIT